MSGPWRALAGLAALSLALAACGSPRATPTSAAGSPRLDAETLALIDRSQRVAFVVPFSHWDTDWHEDFAAYVQRSDSNVLAAIQMSEADPRFRYTLEQVLFVQHFWETYPEHRARLAAAVARGQITFAWGGLTQPETSLVAPAIQVRNLLLGREWIAETFGPEHVPVTAWQSDAFGNSAAFPAFLASFDIPYLFIGRWQHRCDPDFEDCQPLPHAFYWSSPASEARVLAVYLSYPIGWDRIHRLADEGEQVEALRQFVEEQYDRTESKYVFIPLGSDFIDPLPNLPALADRWNAAGGDTALVMADPLTVFQYLETQPLPHFTVDLNPIWQAFYGTRPYAKVADKESEYLLTAADKFGLFLDAPAPTAWPLAGANAHYDNISGVGYDWVWEGSQQPRYAETLASASEDLALVLARIAAGVEAEGVPAPLVVFNPLSWPRSEVIEIAGPAGLPGPLTGAAQRIQPDSVALLAEAVPPVGFAMPQAQAAPLPPASASRSGDAVTLSNGLVSVTLDAAHGAAFSSLGPAGGPSALAGFGDDVVYLEDSGDVYGARFGEEVARASLGPADIEIVAEGPLLARARAALALAGQPITKTVTLRAGSPLIEVALEIAGLPETSALMQTQLPAGAEARTDDLGFLAFEHSVDDRPIQPGDITYRREIFYPIMAWSAIPAGGSGDAGLALITHGLQGLGGLSGLNLLLVRDVSDEDREGVTDRQLHTLRYAYYPFPSAVADSQPWQAAYAFNQPLLAAWRSGGQVCVQAPFGLGPLALHGGRISRCYAEAELQAAGVKPFPPSMSLLAAEGGLAADLFRHEGRVQALVLAPRYDPELPVTLTVGRRQYSGSGLSPELIPIELP
jgi:hypothetical protein